MSYKSTLPVSASLELTGLSEAQEAACYAAMQAFQERNRLTFWGLKIDLIDDGPQNWRITVSVEAPSEFDFQVRSTQVSVNKTVDLAQVVDLCLETHYNACMNGKARSNRSEGVFHRVGSFY
jgi:hypothetical protein